MSHARPASWQHWADTLKASKSTFKDKGRVHTSRTLFLAQIPANISVSDLESLFRQAPGYVTARRVRSMGFIDFESKQQATDALGRFQGHRFPGAERGLLISYDKDDEEERGGSSKRQHEEMRRRKEELERTYTKLHCYVCAHFALKLTTELAQLPVRKTDGSRVVSEAQLVSLDMVRTRPPPTPHTHTHTTTTATSHRCRSATGDDEVGRWFRRRGRRRRSSGRRGWRSSSGSTACSATRCAHTPCPLPPDP